MTSTNAPRMPEMRRASLTSSFRWSLAAGGGTLLTLLLLFVHVFVPADWLQLVSIWILGGSLLCLWIGIVTWRIPVVGNRTLLLLGIAWLAGISTAIWLAGWAVHARPPIWRYALQWLGLTLSLVVGALLLRALLRKRAAPVVGRLLPLVSPLIVLLVILVSALVRGR